LRGKSVRCKRCERSFRVGSQASGDAAELAEVEPAALPVEDEASVRVSGRPAQPRSSSDRDDDEPSPRRRRQAADYDEEDDDLPRRRRPAKKSSFPVALVVGGGVVLFLLLIGVVVLAFLWMSRSSAGPGGQPSNPPPFAGMNPAAPPAQAGGPMQGVPPGAGMPPGVGAPPGAGVPPGIGAPPGGGAPDNQNTITLSNPRRGGGIRMGPRNGFSVDYKFSQGGAQIGMHYRLVIKPARGGISHGDLHGVLHQEGTLEFTEFGFGNGTQGSCELYLERSNIPGPFGKWEKVSNSVTLN